VVVNEMRKKAIRQRIALSINELLHRDDGVEHIVMAVDGAQITHTHSFRPPYALKKARLFKTLLRDSDVTYTNIKIVRRAWQDGFVYKEPEEVR
jgi:hypothetical protein